MLCTLEPHSVEDDEHNETEYLSQIRVELFPTDNPLVLLNEASDEEHQLTIVPEQAEINEDLSLAQTMNQSETTTNNLDILHLPPWYIETMTYDLEPVQIHNDISKRCWLTEDLQEEIRHNYPSKEEV